MNAIAPKCSPSRVTTSTQNLLKEVNQLEEKEEEENSLSVTVALRIKPLDDSRDSISVRPGERNNTVKAGYDGKIFSFDFVHWSISPKKSDNRQFGTTYASQQQVFNDLGQRLVRNSLKGFNCSLFAYGQTGSGKTFTMFGETEHPERKGLVPRICEALLEGAPPAASAIPSLANTPCSHLSRSNSIDLDYEESPFVTLPPQRKLKMTLKQAADKVVDLNRSRSYSNTSRTPSPRNQRFSTSRSVSRSPSPASPRFFSQTPAPPKSPEELIAMQGYYYEVTYVEIYMEKVRDLLNAESVTHGHGSLKVREHPKKGPYISGALSVPVTRYQDIEELMDWGQKQRATASTKMNATSSRSHAVFTITVTKMEYDPDTMHLDETVSKVNLIDLAGSENASDSGSTGQRLKEGSAINKSLLYLGRVIHILSINSAAEREKRLGQSLPSAIDTGSPKNKMDLPPALLRKTWPPPDNQHETAHKKVGGSQSDLKRVPYRDSVLTYLLKESLGGNAKTTMIANIRPGYKHLEETLTTLRYAMSAQAIVNHAVINEDPKTALIKRLRNEIQELQMQLAESERMTEIGHHSATDLLDQSGRTNDGDFHDMGTFEDEIEDLNREIEEKNDRITQLESQNSKSKEDIASVKEKISELSKELKTSCAQVRNLEANNDRLFQQCQRANETVAAKENENETMMVKMKALEAASTENSARIEDQENQIENLKSMHAELKKVAEERAQLLTEGNGIVSRLQEKLKCLKLEGEEKMKVETELQIKLSSLDREVTDKKDEVRQLQISAKSAQDKADHLLQENEKSESILRKRLGDREKEISELKLLLLQEKSSKNELQREVTNKEAEIHQLKELTGEAERVQKTQTDYSQKLDLDLQHAREEAENIRTALTQQQAELKAVFDEKELTETKASKLKVRLLGTESELKKREDDIQQLLLKIQNCKTHVHELEAIVSEKDVQIQQKQSRLTSAEKQMQEATEKVSQSECELAQTTTLIQDLQLSLDKATSLKSENERQLKLKCEEARRSQQTNQQLSAELKEAITKLGESKRNEEAKEFEIIELTSHISKVKTALSEAQKDNENKGNILSGFHEKMRSNNMELEKLNDSLCTSNRQLEASKAECQQMGDEVSKLKKQLGDLTEQLQQQQKQSALLKEDLQISLNDKQKLDAALHQSNQLVESKCQELDKSKSAEIESNKEVAGLRETLVELRKHSQEVIKSEEKMQSEMDALQEHLHEVKFESDKISKEKSQLLKELEEAKANLSKRQNDVEKTLHDKMTLDSEVEAKNREIQQLQDELDGEKTLRLALNEEHDKLQNMHKSLEKTTKIRALEKEDALSQVQSLNTVIQGLQEEIEIKNGDLHQNQLKLKQFEKQVHELNERISAYEAESRRSIFEIQNLQSCIEVATSLQSESDKTLQAKNEEIQQWQVSHQKLLVQLQGARLEVGEHKRKEDNKEFEINELKSEVSNLLASLEEAQKDITNKGSIISNFHEKMQSSSRELAELKRCLQKSNQKLESNEIQCQQLHVEAEDLKQQLKEAKQECEDHKANNDLLTKTLEQASSDRKTLEASFCQMKETAESNEKEHEESLKKEKNQVSELTLKLDQLEAAFSNVKSEHTKTLEDYGDLKIQSKANHTEAQQLKSELEKKTRLEKSLKEQLDTSQSLCLSNEKKLKLLNQRNKDGAAELQTIKSNLNHTEDLLDNCQKELKETESEVLALSAQNKTLTTANESLKTANQYQLLEIEKLSSEVDSIKECLKAAEKSVLTHKSESAKLSKDIQDKAQEISRLQCEIESKEDKMAQFSSRLESQQQANDELTQNMAQMEQDMSTIQIDNQFLQKTIKSCESKVLELSNSNAREKEKCLNAQIEAENLSHQIGKTSAELNGLKTEIETLNQCMVEKEEALQQAQQKNGRLSAEVQSCKNSLVSLEKKLESKETEKKELKGKIEMLVVELGELQTKNQESEQMFLNQVNETQMVQSKCEQLTTSHQKMEDMLKEKADNDKELQNRLLAEQTSNQELQREIQNKTAEYEALELKCSHLCSEIEALQSCLSESERMVEKRDKELLDKQHKINEAILQNNETKAHLNDERKKYEVLKADNRIVCEQVDTLQTRISEFCRDKAEMTRLRERDAQQAKLVAQQQILKDESEKLEAKLQENKIEMKRLHGIIEHVSSEKGRLEKIAASTKREADLTNAHLFVLKGELDQCKTELCRLQNKEIMKSAITEQQQTHEDDQQIQARKVSAEVKSQSLLIERFEGDLSSKRAEIEELSQRNNEQSIQILKLKSDLDKAETVIAVKETEVKRLKDWQGSDVNGRSQLEQKYKQTSREVSTVRQQLVAKELELNRLKASKVDSENAIDGIYGKLVNLGIQTGASKDAVQFLHGSPTKTAEDIETLIDHLRPAVEKQQSLLKEKEHELNLYLSKVKVPKLTFGESEEVQVKQQLGKEQHLRDTVNALQSRVDTLEFDLEKEKLENGRLQRQLVSKDQELSLHQCLMDSTHCNSVNEPLERENKDLYGKLHALQAQLSVSNASVKALEHETQQLRSSAQFSENEVNVLKAYLEEKNATISKLRETIGCIHQDIRDTEKVTQNHRHEEIVKQQKLGQALHERKAKISVLEQTIQGLCNDVEGYLSALSGTGVGQWAAAAAQLTPLKLDQQFQTGHKASNNNHYQHWELDDSHTSSHSLKSNQQDAHMEEQARDLKKKITRIKQKMSRK